ncbi:MAG TPA: hypothetical protein VK139_06100 [Microbacteriaceae bacterium]|nr:hypothetical protein [Microbacteriaceae bacterium]
MPPASAVAPLAPATAAESAPTPAAPDVSPHPSSQAPLIPAIANTPAPVPVPASAASAAAAAPTAQPTPSPTDEVAATERMYLAHAPLRDPEVADPDSGTNRRILETMVLKGLTPQATNTTQTLSAAAN